MRQKAIAAAVLFITLLATRASAQIVYEPVQYQHVSGGQPFYYGGSDPAIIAYAEDQARCRAHDYRAGRREIGHEVTGLRSVRHERAAVYSDCVPFTNARLYGYTASDARAEAFARSPSYFRKADLLRAVVVQEDGSVHVPAQPLYRSIKGNGLRQSLSGDVAGAGSAIRKGVILIIPKKNLRQQTPAKAVLFTRADLGSV